MACTLSVSKQFNFQVSEMNSVYNLGHYRKFLHLWLACMYTKFFFQSWKLLGNYKWTGSVNACAVQLFVQNHTSLVMVIKGSKSPVQIARYDIIWHRYNIHACAWVQKYLYCNNVVVTKFLVGNLNLRYSQLARSCYTNLGH